jgi:hypothetical protein
MAHKHAHIRAGQRAAALARQHMIERGNKVRRRIDERAVQIEDDGGVGKGDDGGQSLPPFGRESGRIGYG